VGKKPLGEMQIDSSVTTSLVDGVLTVTGEVTLVLRQVRAPLQSWEVAIQTHIKPGANEKATLTKRGSQVTGSL